MTEAAIVLPLIIMLVFGIAQYALIFSAYITLSNSAAEGARMAITLGATGNSGAVEAYVAGTLAPTTLNPQDATVAFDPAFSTGGQTVKKVTITYPLNLFFPIVVPQSANGVLQLTASSVAR